MKNPGGIRGIAFHLPQFHPIPENDEWWGKGFTEWTNVVKTRPRLPGHYQPHLPADLGFYDLRLPEARAAQATLAAEYGIYGFCYFHYWFHGRQLLERPVNEILRSGEPDFPFCLCWANESWSRRWDGSENQLLIEQRYSAQDDLEHIQTLLPFFLDRRYVRVMGRPMMAVYRATQLPDPRRTVDLWRREAERAGLPGLYMVRVESHEESGDPAAVGFDAALQFEPRWAGLGRWQIFRRKWWHRHALGTGEAVYKDNLIYEYKDLVERALATPVPSYPRIPCVCPSWDNSARRAKGAVIFLNSAPQLYERWLREVANRQKVRIPVGPDGRDSFESLVFINAWNEWAEGNHLEPCQKWGRTYLEATRRVLGVKTWEAVEYADR
jgi:lipopolysaccharide biosynthesis protein